MKSNPLSQSDKNLITQLQGQLDAARERLRISERGEILFREYLSSVDDEVVLVEADGLGGGTLRIVKGNYPEDYVTREEHAFPTEAEAEEAAADLCE